MPDPKQLLDFQLVTLFFPPRHPSPMRGSWKMTSLQGVSARTSASPQLGRQVLGSPCWPRKPLLESSLCTSLGCCTWTNAHTPPQPAPSPQCVCTLPAHASQHPRASELPPPLSHCLPSFVRAVGACQSHQASQHKHLHLGQPGGVPPPARLCTFHQRHSARENSFRDKSRGATQIRSSCPSSLPSQAAVSAIAPTMAWTPIPE
mmetsp:Transcript_39812/g.91815  ORF Transcript_39812/g.91815 Transcript_39812/m.91815 type:complete len:204 (+) Transcript_39812:371-982(+)